MKTNSISKRIILEELEENTHPEHVEDVIFWALEHYANSEPKGTMGRVVAFSIKERILREENIQENSIEPKKARINEP